METRTGDVQFWRNKCAAMEKQIRKFEKEIEEKDMRNKVLARKIVKYEKLLRLPPTLNEEGQPIGTPKPKKAKKVAVQDVLGQAEISPNLPKKMKPEISEETSEGNITVYKKRLRPLPPTSDEEGQPVVTPKKAKKVAVRNALVEAEISPNPAKETKPELPVETSDSSIEWEKVFEVLENPKEKVLKTLIPFLDKKDVLKCRMICRRWNNVISKYFEIHPLTLPISVPPDNFNASGAHQLFRGFTLTLGRIKEFYEYFKTSTPSNKAPVPFISRNLTMLPQVEIGNNAGVFFQKVNLILETIGQHVNVWYLTVAIAEIDGDGSPSPSDYYRWIQNCLIKMKNLKSLTLLGALNPDHDLDEKKLDMKMRPFRLPKLPNLEFLCIAVEFLPLKVEEILFTSYVSQLKKVKLSLPTLLNCREETKDKFSNLIQLVIYSGSCDDDEEEEKEQEEGLYQMLANLQAPNLQRLLLDLQNAKTHKVLSLIQNFPKLIDLQITSANAIEHEHIENVVTSIPTSSKLLSLEICDKSTANYNFLLDIQTLEYLRIQGSSNDALETTDQIQVGKSADESVDIRNYLYTGRMYESKVWEQLPSLKQFLVDDIDYDYEIPKEPVLSRYTRHGYQDIMGRKDGETCNDV